MMYRPVILADIDDLYRNQAIVILAVGLVLAVLVLLIIVHLDRKAFKRQMKGLDTLMEGTVKNGLLHSEKDFAAAANHKSQVALFRAIRLTLPLAVIVIVLAAILGASLTANLGEWWMFAKFGFSPTMVDIGDLSLWGELKIGQDYLDAIAAGQLYLAILIPALNLVGLALVLQLLYSLQGYLARRLEISRLVKSGWSGIVGGEAEKKDSNANKKPEDTEK